MDVQMINLIHSAEKLIQDKKSFSGTHKGDAQEKLSQDTVSFNDSLGVRYQAIQTKLKDLQDSLTKEQTKSGILAEENIKEEDLISVLFGNSPLFPEIKEGQKFSKEDLISQIQVNKNSLVDRIRTLEVESENIFSLGVLQSSDKFTKSISEMASKEIPMKEISEKTVAETD